jgi:ComF family protein
MWIFKTPLRGLCDTVFPRICVVCGAVLSGNRKDCFCFKCLSRISFVKPPICSCCGLPFFDCGGTDHLCSECISLPQYFSIARSVGRYETTLRDAIHRFKYKGKIAVGEALGRLMAEYKFDSFSIEDYSLIMPVPLHRRRLRERGFNQSLVLAKEVAGRHSINLDFTTLKRVIYTEPQVNLDRKKRGSNVKGAFKITDSERVKGKRVVLIDDVYTTGSTLRECARVLIRSGAADVAALTLARAVF